MKVNDLINENIPELKIDDKFISKLVKPKVKLDNCSYGPREVVEAIGIPDSIWKDESNHEELEKFTQSVNRAVTKAISKEVQKIRKKKGLEKIKIIDK